MKKPHKHAELIKAWADGAKIQLNDDGFWIDIEPYGWDVDLEYRIKPEPKPDVAMTDKELLELAAKAAGIEVYRWPENEPVCLKLKETNDRWNPLTDDGDALRLVVRLKMDIIHDFDRVMVVYGDGEATLTTEYFYDLPIPTDQYAATRRAIVRAAVEIGKTL